MSEEKSDAENVAISDERSIFIGEISDFRYYDDVLSERKIKEIMEGRLTQLAGH
jgi:hypothetical protein